jgi:hypothetical protein
MRKIKALALSIGLSVMTLGGLLTILAPQPVAAAHITDVKDCSMRFLTFPTWFNGLVEIENDKCIVSSPDAVGGIGPFIWRIVLNVIEIALQLVIYAAIGFILYGGFQFMTSGGSPDVAAKSRQTIINGAIGIAISIGAIAILNLVSGILIVNP